MGKHSTRLSDYPRPSVAVDIALLTVVGDRLRAVVQRDAAGRPALPGRFIREHHTVEETVREVLELKLGLSPDHVHPHLLRVFSDPDRDPRGWTISIAHSVALPPDELSDVVGELVPLSSDGRLESGEHLLYDHDQILASATDTLRRRYEERPDPDGMLLPPYTLSDLRKLHETVLGRNLMRDTFNRRAERLLSPLAAPSGEQAKRVDGGRPARLYEPAEEAPTATFGYRLPGRSE